MPVPTNHFKTSATADGDIQGRHPQHVGDANRFVRLFCGPGSMQQVARHNQLTLVKWLDAFVIRSGLTPSARVWTENHLDVSTAEICVFGHPRGRYPERIGDLFGGTART